MKTTAALRGFMSNRLKQNASPRQTLGSTGCQPVVSGSLPETQSARVSVSARPDFSASCRKEQAGSLRYPENAASCGD
jgi:hypothetical protein